MTQYTVFTTPGNLDLTSLTTFGMNVKPNTTNPIGFFGTGLKYAIAVLLRHEIPVTIYTGGHEYHFYTKEKDFRGKAFKTCRYKAKGIWKGWKYVDLPFTTELGKHWELWQAFRELYSNTLDEGGYLGTPDDNGFPVNKDMTYIVVRGLDFARIAEFQLDNIFLPKDKLKLVAASKDIEIYEGSSRYIYYRGLRAYDLNDWEKSSMYTYNYIGPSAQLTEDRTIKYLFYVKDAIAELVAKSDDRKLIGSIIKPADRWFEKAIDYNQVYGKSDTFNSVVYRVGSSPVGPQMAPTVRSYYSDVLSAQPKIIKQEVSDEVWKSIQITYEECYNKEGDTSVASGIHTLYEALAKKFNRTSKSIEQPSLFGPDGDDIPF